MSSTEQPNQEGRLLGSSNSPLNSVADAQRALEWVKSVLPDRVAQLSAAVEQEAGRPIPLSRDALPAVGAWLDKRIAVLPRSEEAWEAKLPEEFRAHTPKVELSPETGRRCVDAAFFFAETLRKEFPQLQWTFITKPKSHIDLYVPVVGPFQKGHLNPFAVMLNIALGSAQGQPIADRLPEVYDYWASFLQPERH